MNTQSHYTVPELGQTFTPLIARNAGWTTLTASLHDADTIIYALRRADQPAIFCVTSQHIVSTLSDNLRVATFASTLTTRRKP